MSPRYPPTRAEETQDVLAGVSFPDPYHWLERDDEEVERWQRAQADLATAHLREWPPFERFRRLVEKFDTERQVQLPRHAGGAWFRIDITAQAPHGHAIVSGSAYGAGQVLFDPGAENAQAPAFLSWIAPSPDGRTLALGVCADGSERNTIRLIDVASGQALSDPPPHLLIDNWTGGVQWLPDSSGFFFTIAAAGAAEYDQQVYFHSRHPSPATVRMFIPWVTPGGYRMVGVSADGGHAVAYEGICDTVAVAIAPLREKPFAWRPFITLTSGTVAGHVVGNLYIAVTDIGAPRGRLVGIPLDCLDPNDPRNWRELIPETQAVLRTVTSIGDALYLTQFVDTYARISIVDRHGRTLGQVPLPGTGAVSESRNIISNLVPRGHPDRFLFGFSSLTESWGIYSHMPGQDGIEILREPAVRLENTVVEDLWATSADGTRIPYHVVRSAAADPAKPQPTLIFGYGGMNATLVPQFPGAMAAFVAAGGVFVHAHLRGGGELGLDWWQGGRFRNKQNCYDDLYAIAQALIAGKRCTPQTLAVCGASHGGLMAAVAATQRPDLWKVAVARVPRADLIGSCRTRYGRMSVQYEHGAADDPETVRWLASVSPYHLVRDGVKYPAMFIDAGATDQRTHAWHARKLAARLQRASAGDLPILLHVWENVGHGWATDKRTAVMVQTEWLAFVARHLNVYG